MPSISIDGGSIQLSRRSGLLDTNVLVALFDPRDRDHDQAEAVLESEDDYTWVVLPPVVIEAVGLLLRRTKDRRLTIELIDWMLNPGNRVLMIPDPNHPLDVVEITRKHSIWMNKYSVDFVDAYVMQSADRLTRRCDLRPHMPVFTFDTSDYFKCSGGQYRFSVYDMRSADGVIEFQ